MRVVIVDDSAKIRSEIRQLVSKQGWEVVGEGETGLEAIELVMSLQPDLLTLDVIMPEMDGIECYRKLRSMNLKTRCILISVLAAEPRVIEAFQTEIYATHFLKKPISEKDFRDRVDGIFKLRPFPLPAVTVATDSEQLPNLS